MTRKLERFALDRILTDAQVGFRSHKRYSDQSLVLRGVCEEVEVDIILGLLGC